MPPTNEPTPQIPHVQPPQPPVTGGVLPPPQPPSQAYAYQVPSSWRKKVILVLLILALLIGGGTAAYFGLILPRSPEYVLGKAFDNTAAGYDRLISYAEEQKDIKGSKTEGSFKVEGEVAADGTFSYDYYEKTSVARFDVGAAGTRLGLEARLLPAANADTPDIYLKASGLKALQGLFGDEMSQSMSQTLAALDEQWILIDHTAFDMLESQVTEAGAPRLNRDDLIDIARVIGRVNREYLWTNDQDRAVFKIVQDLGTTDRDGHKSHHYKVGYHKAHLKTYLTTLKDELQKTKLGQIAPDQDLGKWINFDELLKSVDELKGTGTADMWVDADTKLIRAVRFTDHQKASEYIEIGLNYNGGDDYPFFVALKTTEDTKAEGKLTVTLNTKADTLKFDLRADIQDESSEKTVVTATAKTEVNQTALNIQKPDGAKPWLEVLGGNPLLLTPPAPSPLSSPAEIEI